MRFSRVAFVWLCLAAVVMAASPVVAPDRMRNLRMLETSPFLFEYHRATIGEESQFFTYPQRDTSFRRNFDQSEGDALVKWGEGDYRVAASVAGGLDYRGSEAIDDTIWPGADAGLFIRGYADSVDFSLEARMYVEAHSAKKPGIYDHEVFDVQNGDVDYVSFSRYRGQFGVNWGHFRLNLARDVLHFGPGFFNNLTLNQFALPYNMLTFDMVFGPLRVFTAYGDLRINNINTDKVNVNERNLYVHRYEIALKNLTIGMSEIQLIYNDNMPWLFVPMVPLFIEKGNYYEASNNGALAMDLNYRLLRTVRLYSEFYLDDLKDPVALYKNERSNNRWAFMAGTQIAHNFYLAGHKLESGTIAEYARVEPFTYIHYVASGGALANMGLPLGNPGGPNSQTVDWLLYVNFCRIFVSLKQKFFWKGDDFGSNLTDNYPQKSVNKRFIHNAKMQYSLTPALSYEGRRVAFMGSVTFFDAPDVYLRAGFKW